MRHGNDSGRPRSRCRGAARVVTLTDSSRPGSLSSRLRAIVDLPAPDGDDSTSISPRRRMRGTDGILGGHAPTPDSGPARGTGRPPPSAPGRSAVSVAAFDFEHSVFDSRLNSCARKSSLRPIGAAACKQRPAGGDMRLQPVDLLADVGLGRQERRLHVQAVSSSWLAASISRRTCSASRSRIDGRLARRVGLGPAASAPRSRRYGREAAPRAPRLRLRRACFKPGQRRVERRAGSRRRARRAPPRSRRSRARRARRAAPAARRRWPARRRTAPRSRLARPARSFRKASLTTGCACGRRRGRRSASPGNCRAKSASAPPAAPAGSRRSKPGGSRSRTSTLLPLTDLTSQAIDVPVMLGDGPREAGHALQMS